MITQIVFGQLDNFVDSMNNNKIIIKKYLIIVNSNIKNNK